MKQTTENEFFAAVGPRDVHPRVDVSTLKGRYHTSDWEDQRTRALVGRTISDSYGIEPTQYMLA